MKPRIFSAEPFSPLPWTVQPRLQAAQLLAADGAVVAYLALSATRGDIAVLQAAPELLRYLTAAYGALRSVEFGNAASPKDLADRIETLLTTIEEAQR